MTQEVMTKQEEIREGIAKYFERTDYGWSALDYADNILSYLHSQGVVIKVDRGLPEIAVEDGCDETCHRVERDRLINTGYIAVEPLIES